MKAYDYHNIIETIDDAASSFGDCITASEKVLFEAAMNAAKELDHDPATGRIKTTTANIARLAKIKSKLENAATSNIFLNGVRELAKTFETIHNEQLQYFRSNFAAKTLDEKGVKDKYTALKKATVANTIEGLTGQGLKTNVTDAISKMLMTAVTTGEKYSDLTEQLRSELISSEDGTSSLAKYAGTYATTAMTQYAGQQNRMFTDDLDIKWFRYVGSTIETTRRFCELLTQKEYIHISEIPDILKGIIEVGGEQKTCPINPKTELPYGLIEGTTPENFAVNVGGWNCRHQLLPIAAEAVPKNIREKFENATPAKKTPEQEWWEKNRQRAEKAKHYLQILLPTTKQLALFREDATAESLEECVKWAWQIYVDAQLKWQNLNKKLNKLLQTATPEEQNEYHTLTATIKKAIAQYNTRQEYLNDADRLNNAINVLKQNQANAKKPKQKTEIEYDSSKPIEPTNLTLLRNIYTEAQRRNVDYKEVQKMKNALTEDEIIKRIGGGDRTEGSCSSLAFAYAANKNNLDVIDYRNGESRKMFASMQQIEEITRRVGGQIEKNYNDFIASEQLFQNVVSGKQYYFATGAHAAIIRRTATGNLEYLELQTQTANGFKPLTTAKLKSRFGAEKEYISPQLGIPYKTASILIDIELLGNCSEFRTIMGYINTNAALQVKGKGGVIK